MPNPSHHASLPITRPLVIWLIAVMSMAAVGIGPRTASGEEVCANCPAATVDWLTLPSTYTHEPENRTRVAQYTPLPEPTAPVDPSFRSSGYTHLRSTLAFGQSADNYHRVETWGDPVRPYGEWRFPYRPFSTPYPNWGPPYAGFNLGFGFPGFPPGAYGPGHGPSPGAGRRPSERPGHRPGHGGRGRRPSEHSPPPASPFNPYPAGPGSPYPVAPYYDGYYPPYRD